MDGIADPHQLLLYHPAGADVQVPDLGVAHLSVRQPDIAARGVQEGMRAALPELREGRGPGEADGIVGLIFTPAEAVEDNQHHRAFGHALKAPWNVSVGIKRSARGQAGWQTYPD